jgi:phosphoglycerol transferase MdoB-like AlkP superfamily enzyme
MTNRSATNLPNIPKTVRLVFSTGIIFLLIMSLLRLGLYLAFPAQGHSFTGVLPSLLLGLRFDLRYVGILCLLLLLLGSLPVFQPFRTVAGRRIVLSLTAIAAFLLVLFYTVDFAHYSYLSQRLNASVLNYASDAGISTRMVWQTYPVFRILLLLVAGVWFVRKIVKWSYDRIRGSRVAGGETDASTGRPRIIWFVVSFLFLGLAVFGRIGQYPLRWSDAFSLGSDYQANLSLNPFQSFFSSLKFRHSAYDEAKVRAALPVLAGYYGFDSNAAIAGRALSPAVFQRQVKPRAGAFMSSADGLTSSAGALTAAAGPLGSRPNVVVVICESFSAYKSSMWGNPLNTTPFFDSLCKDGIFFDRCFTPSYGTARGVWAVVTGIPDVAAATTTSSRNPAAVDQHTIINDFEGYDKNYFLGGSTSWANIRGLLTNNIRDLRLYEQQDYSAPKVDVWGISDKNLFLEANKVLKKEQAPFFAVIQTADNHRPYTIPEEDRQAFHPVTMPADSLRRYGFGSNEEMNAFRYTDFGYRTFIEAASKEKYFANTIFLFVGDHGIPGDAGALFPRAWTDQRLTAEHVPMLIWSPALRHPRRIAGICSQVDVLPTLAGLCGMPYRNTTLGRDLLDTAAYADKGLAFIYDPDQAYIGVIKGDYFYRRQLTTGKEEMVSVVNNSVTAPAMMTGPVKRQLQQLSDGLYEVSRFMLLTNKKAAQR